MAAVSADPKIPTGTVAYAIGDVHGCLDLLDGLLLGIESETAAIAGEKWIVMLGDYIDRGPDSSGVIAHLLAPPPADFRRFCLRGNHEQVMLDFLRDPETNAYWLGEGGIETLESYGVDLGGFSDDAPLSELVERMEAVIPAAHLSFLNELPFMLVLPRWVFVHAGIRPGIDVDRQRDDDLIWIREEFHRAPPTPGWRIVHGHTPAREPVVTPARICVDTHCFFRGRLTAVRVTPDGETAFLSVG